MHEVTNDFEVIMVLNTKRIFDIITASCGLLVFSPALGLISILIKFEDGGPIFYRGNRIGKHGKPFKIYKFRTMVVDAEKTGVSSTANSDSRITKIGKFLRRYKLDELSQLINVVKGDMSIVGPRPEVEKFVNLYKDEEKALLEVCPGITDWASIWNNDEGSVIAASGFSDPDEAYEKIVRPTKIKLQLKYVKSHSLWIDLEIIFRTILAVLDNNHDVSDLAPPLSKDVK